MVTEYKEFRSYSLESVYCLCVCQIEEVVKQSEEARSLESVYCLCVSD